jgi:hypothetical protein
VAIAFEGEREGRRVVEVTCRPKPEAAVVWGKVDVLVQAADRMPLSELYYDEQMQLARTMTYEEVEELGGRRLPLRLRVVPADKPGESTLVVYQDIAFDVALPPDTFSLRTLQR